MVSHPDESRWIHCHPDDIPFHLMSSGLLNWGWYLIRMSYGYVIIMSSGWDTLPCLSHPDEIANFDFSQHAVAFQRFRKLGFILFYSILFYSIHGTSVNTMTQVRLPHIYGKGGVAMFPGSYVPPHLCSPAPMFPGTDVPPSNVPQYLCSPAPMFPCPIFPGTYVPQYLYSPVPMLPRPMFPSAYVPPYLCSPVSPLTIMPSTYVPHS